MKIIEFLKAWFQKLFGRDENVVMYITGEGSLPEPLCESEEKDALSKLKSGDSAIREKLIVHNLRLVVYIAKKFDNTGLDQDDLISVGTIGLIKAVGSFDSDKNIKLATYASRCIENEILMYLRRMVRIKSEISLDEPLNVDYEGNELLMSDVLGTDPDTVSKNLETSVEKQLLWQALEKLDKREREIMSMRFGLYGTEEKTQKEVADSIGISQSYISRLEKKIIGRLKKEISRSI